MHAAGSPYARFTNDDLILRDVLAVERTVVAVERTLLGYVRTALALVALGASLVEFGHGKLSALGGWSLVAGACPLLLVGVLLSARRWRQLRPLRRRVGLERRAAGP